MTEEEQKHLRELAAYVDEQARVADANSKEWRADVVGGKENAAYRKGMWYAYNDVRNRLPKTPTIEESVAGLVQENNELRDCIRSMLFGGPKVK